MPDRYYAFAVGRIRVLETRLLSRARLERMAEAADFAEALTLLGETEYASLVQARMSPSQIAQAELARVRDLALQLAPDAPELEFLLWRWDLLNLKSLLRQELAGVQASLNDLGRYGQTEMAGWFKGEGPKLPPIFARARQAGESAYAGTKDPQLLDAAIDRLYYGEGSRLWSAQSSFLPGYWRMRIDLTNLRILVRSKRLGFDRGRLTALLLPGGSVEPGGYLAALDRPWEEITSWWVRGPCAGLSAASGGLQDLPALERASEDLLLERAKIAKGVPLGLEPVLGYYLAKEHETRLVNLVLTAKAAGVPAGGIKERLRSVYT